MGTIILALGLMAFKPAGELAIGSALPKAYIQLQDVSGKEISLQSAINHNGLLVIISCSTCPM